MDQLPNEMITKILGYLKSVDLLHFCQAYEHLDYFLREKRIIRYLDWSRLFELHNFNLCRFISSKTNPSYISTLNVSCLYWIPANQLRKLVRKLENLEELVAIDTQLGLRENDVKEYSKLKKIAVTVDDHFEHATVEASRHLSALKSLYLKVVSLTQDHERITGMRQFFRNIKQLEELWICDEHVSVYIIPFDQLLMDLKNLKKLVIRSNDDLAFLDFTSMGLSKIFECRRRNEETEIIFERIPDKTPSLKRSIFEPKENELEKAWEVFEKFRIELPCGPRDCKFFSLNGAVTNINFEELNFSDRFMKCNMRYVRAALQVLSSENSKTLKKLSFRPCLFQNSSVPQYEEFKGFKKIRYGIKMKAADHPFHRVAENLEKLTELEIHSCTDCSANGVMPAYPIIANFENLQKLILYIPHLLDGWFLKQMFMKCQKLEWLSLTCLTQNEKFMINLCENLKFSTSLKHFRLDHKEFVIDRLLPSLTRAKKKPLRIYLSCENLRYTNNLSLIESFSVFMENNPQLIFFYLTIGNITVNQISDIRKVVYDFKRGDPAKIFEIVKRKSDPLSRICSIPNAHYDLILNKTKVAVINFDEF